MTDETDINAILWTPRHPCRPGFSGLRFAPVP